MDSVLLTAIVFTPLIGAAFIALFLRQQGIIRIFAILVALLNFGLTVVAFSAYDHAQGGLQLVVREPWIVPLDVEFFIALDGLNTPLVLLTGLLGLVAVLSSWNVNVRPREYFSWLLLLQTSVMGVFVSLDFVLFFVFWELELIPLYFLISIWGTGRKEYSAMKFLLFTLFGSAFMLVGILVLYFSTGTFDMVVLGQSDLGNLLIPTQLIFGFFFLAFAIKLPTWPVHSWLPDAHTDAPTAGSVMLAGVLIKMGGYGLIRVCIGMFPGPSREYAWILITLGVISIIYGAVVTVRQTDLKRLIAFSSISHMGFVLVGISSVGAVAGEISPVGLNGAAIQMFTHGTITGLLFLVVGFIYEKTHTRYIPDLSGLASRMPFLTIFFVIAGLASLGLPGLSGFVAELVVFLGAFFVWSWPTAVAVFGIVLTAGYILWMIQRVMFGPVLARYATIGDATLIERIPILLLFVSILVVGIYPAVISDVFLSGISPIVFRFG